MEITKNEEDYLKALFHITIEGDTRKAGTNQLADYLNLSPASVNGMLKKLKAKKLVKYEKYGKLELSPSGEKIAVNLIRKHRLWETFLYEHLEFSWDEVHDVAEQLEHVQSEKLVDKLDDFLDHPKFDPHGDAIPNADGKLEIRKKKTLAKAEPGTFLRLTAVKDSSAAFLQFVSELGLGLKSKIKVVDKQSFDNSMEIEIDGRSMRVSEKFCKNIYVIDME